MALEKVINIFRDGKVAREEIWKKLWALYKQSKNIRRNGLRQVI